MTAGAQAASTHSPVAATTRRRVVVGVDGSPNSIEALRTAVAEASARNAIVDVVYAFHAEATAQTRVFSAPYRDTFGPGLVLPADTHDAEVEAKAVLNRCMALAFPHDPPSVRTRLIARSGTSRDVLLAAAEGADLLVLGARRRAGPLSVSLGSTAQSCSQHANCPVLVVPASACGTFAVGQTT